MPLDEFAGGGSGRARAAPRADAAPQPLLADGHDVRDGSGEIDMDDLRAWMEQEASRKAEEDV